MNHQQIKSHNDLRVAIIKDKPSLIFNSTRLNFHFCEEQVLMISTPMKLLMCEFKAETAISQNSVMKFVDCFTQHVKMTYDISLYVRQAIFNRSNIITIYTAIRRSPRPKRRQIETSGISSGSESATSINSGLPLGKLPCDKSIAFVPSTSQELSTTRSPPHQAGELEARPFNGQTHLMPIIRTSTGQQTDKHVDKKTMIEPPTVAIAHQINPASVYIDIEKQKNINQILQNITFPKVRRFLAYFVHNKSAVLNEESYLDLKIRLHNDGLIGSDEEILQQYITALKSRDFTEKNIKEDLKTLQYNMECSKLKQTNASRLAFEQFYTGRVKIVTRPPIQSPPGRFDPELCTIA